MAFVHLHNHSEYSLLDGSAHVLDIAQRAADLGMSAVAVTDHGVMSAAPELEIACAKVSASTGKPLKPIFGCEVYLTLDESLARDKKPKLYHMLLLAKNNEGYHNLVKLVSESHIENFYYKPRTTVGMLKKYGSGIIGTSACLGGLIPKLLDANKFDEALHWAREFAQCFDPGDFYIELQDQGLITDGGKTQNALNHELTQLAQQAGLQTIATNDFHYLTQEDSKMQDLMLCIGTGSTVNDEKRMKFENDQFYMKSEDEMRAALSDFPEACDNTVSLAEKCNVVLEKDILLPEFPVPEGMTEESYFRQRIEEGLRKRYGNTIPEEVQKRYEYEAGVIIQQGFPAYFLVVEEYIAWAKDRGIGVGPGRGSAAGSLVAYALGITGLDPLEHGLLFERFLSPERVEMPDIDVDFDDERRGEVFQHVRDFYGAEKVAGVITFSGLKAKAAIKDSARVLDYPIALANRISKMVGDEIGITISKALAVNPEFKEAYEKEDDVRSVVDAASSIEGHIRGEGVHACAQIICRDALSNHIPVKRDSKNGGMITQFDGHVTPDLGLLKMDFLGLRTLSVITRACKNIRERFGIEIVPEEISLNDPDALNFMGGGNMDGLFQVESSLYVTLFAQLPPKAFSDIVASIALNRPGPLESGMVSDYIAIATGKKQVHYYDDRLRPILEETYGTIIYQEQIMQISMVMSGFSAGKADKLRKAMGKKNIDIMRQLKEDWNSGAAQNGYDPSIAAQIWEDAEKFAKYAFNKSHSAAYAVLVMQTAYLKAKYPIDFMAAVLSSYMGSADKLVAYIASCKRSGIDVKAPDINTSNLEFTPTNDGILFGLAGVRGVGEKVAEEIIKERRAHGNFANLHNFVSRMDSKTFNRKTLESLIKAGAFDTTGYTRKQLMFFLEETPMLETATRAQKEEERGLSSLFAGEEEAGAACDIFAGIVPKPDGIEWPDKEKLAFEKEILKIYVSDHPLNRYSVALATGNYLRLDTVVENACEIKGGKFAGLITEVSTQFTKKGTKMAKFTLEDLTGYVKGICFDYDKVADILLEDQVVVITGNYEISDWGNQLILRTATQLKRKKKDEDSRVYEATLSLDKATEDRLAALKNYLDSIPGEDAFVISFTVSGKMEFQSVLPFRVNSNAEEFESRVLAILG